MRLENKWQNTQEALINLSERKSTAINRYRELIETGMREGIVQDLSGGGLIRSYGGWEHVESVCKEHDPQFYTST